MKNKQLKPGTYSVKLSKIETIKDKNEIKQLKLIYKSKNPKLKNIKLVASYDFGD